MMFTGGSHLKKRNSSNSSNGQRKYERPSRASNFDNYDRDKVCSYVLNYISNYPWKIHVIIHFVNFNLTIHYVVKKLRF